jgi:predicted transposase/invertase (TIGR01784 family)
MVSIIHHPHDKLFQLSMEEPRVYQEFLVAHLPADLLKRINLHALQLENDSFIDAAYKGTEADIVFSVPLDGATSYIYLLLEHQSEIDPLIAFRLLIYRVRLMERHQKKYPDQPLPLIYPLVVYNGERPWETPIDFFALFSEHSELAKTWWLNPTPLVDIQKLPDDEIVRRRWSGLMEYVLKYRKIIDFKSFLEKLLPWIHTIERTDAAGFSLSKIVIKYVLNGTDTQGAKLFVQKMQNYLSPELRGEVMTLAQEFRQEGVHQGEAAVITRLLKRRFRLPQIPDSYLAKLEQADAEMLLLWSDKILDAKSLEEIFE